MAVSASLRLRCDAWPGVGVAELATRPEGRSAQTAATSQLTKRASAPAPRPSIAAATEIAPAGYRLPRGDVVGVQPSRANTVSAKSCPGRPRRIVARRLGLLDFVAARLRASSTDSSHLFERSGLRARSELRDGPRNQANPGKWCEAPTALPMRRGLPGHDFAACLWALLHHSPCCKSRCPEISGQ